VCKAQLLTPYSLLLTPYSFGCAKHNSLLLWSGEELQSMSGVALFFLKEQHEWVF